MSKRYMIKHVRSGEVFVYDPDLEATCGPLHYSERDAPLADYHCDDEIVGESDFSLEEFDWSDWAILREEESAVTI